MCVCVAREMLCGLVRRAFKQTEEQQLQFEQMLKHDYGRRSKGEVYTVGPHRGLSNLALYRKPSFVRFLPRS